MTKLNTQDIELLKSLGIDPEIDNLEQVLQSKITDLQDNSLKIENSNSENEPKIPKNDVKNDPNNTRIVFKLPIKLAPFKFAILPLMKKDGMKEKAEEIYVNLRKMGISCDFDESGSIGKRYRRQDENGTPFCVCVDYQSLEDGTVTVRNRDDMTQNRHKIEDLPSLLV